MSIREVGERVFRKEKYVSLKSLTASSTSLLSTGLCYQCLFRLRGRVFVVSYFGLLGFDGLMISGFMFEDGMNNNGSVAAANSWEWMA